MTPAQGPDDAHASRIAEGRAKERSPDAVPPGPPPRHGIHGADLPTRHLTLDAVQGSTLTLKPVDGHPLRVHLTFAEHDLLRLEVLPTGVHPQPRTWVIVGEDGDVPFEGRDRSDLSRFTQPAIGTHVTLDATHADHDPRERLPFLTLQSERLHVHVDLAPFALTIARPDGTILHRDVATGAHGHHPGEGVTWHWRRDDDEVLYGLGEASGPIDRSRRRVRFRPLDALAYDARSGDPLYKHLPILTTLQPDGRASTWLIDDAAEIVYDLGAEVDNYHGPYRHVRVMEEGLDAWFLAGPTLPDVLERVAFLTGRPPVPPRWTLGYLASTMHYTDAEDPTAAFEGFVRDLETHQIHCSGMHLSSGYSMHDDGLRYVFAWNERRIPHPPAMIEPLRNAAIRTIANLKPAVLTSHPEFDHLAANGWLVREAHDDTPYLSRFWGGEGAYVDFTNPGAVAWWQERVAGRILDVGIDIAWNDNNEFQIWDDAARTHAGPTRGLRPILTQLMNRATLEAQDRHAPDVRPWTLTRSGMLGSWRYAQTWTGDNHTDWTTLRYNVPQGLNLSLSGWSSYGHDVGGFAGPMPDAELLVRWLEHGVAMPRFVLHSWNDDGTVTEPWSHPEVLPQVRNLLELRDRLVPYLYTAFVRSVEQAEPIARPLAYDFPTWQPGHREDLVHMLGPALLIAPIIEPGADTRTLTLPPGRWCHLATGEVHEGESKVTVPAPLGIPVWFLREGHALPIATAEAASDLVTGGTPWPEGAGVDWIVFPTLSGEATGCFQWDDGRSRRYHDGERDVFDLTVTSKGSARVRIQHASQLGLPEIRVRDVPKGPPGDTWWNRLDLAEAYALDVTRDAS